MICLHNIFYVDTQIIQEEDFLPNAPKNNLFRCWNFEFYKKYKSILFDFHKADNNQSKKPYMVTPCIHIFHTHCLEAWISQKKECPYCRKEIENI